MDLVLPFEQYYALIDVMDPLNIRDELRNFLNLDDVSLADIERETTLNRSWLSKFKRGELTNPTIENLNALHRFRETWLASRLPSDQSAA